jgi:hypothetical protein
VEELLYQVLASFNDVKWSEIYTAEQLAPEPSSFEVNITTEKLKRYVTKY